MAKLQFIVLIVFFACLMAISPSTQDQCSNRMGRVLRALCNDEAGNVSGAIAACCPQSCSATTLKTYCN
uniref:Putative secreted protein n=1 Tax=Culex tarsalis TaxID=7177 RepID=A0A1Q3FRT1_CULTA